jgi:hypothetical protein
VQLAAAEGSARNTDFNLLGGAFGSRAGGSVGAYANTPEGKVLVAAFTDSMNNLIRALKSYQAQTVKGGLGAGGQLAVQGGVQGNSMAGGSSMFEGVMTERNYNSAVKVYEYAIVLKDKSQTYRFNSPRKILFKNDLVGFDVVNGKVDENSIRLLEAKYFQKYWQ